MKLELLVSASCPACQRAEAIWAQVAADHALPLQICDITSQRGERIRTELALQTVPAILIDGELKGIGVQTVAQATRMIEDRRQRNSKPM